MNSINKVASWTTRACDWYNSERRIIFATKSEKERRKWIKYFRTFAIEKPKPVVIAKNETEISDFNALDTS